MIPKGNKNKQNVLMYMENRHSVVKNFLTAVSNSPGATEAILRQTFFLTAVF